MAQSFLSFFFFFTVEHSTFYLYWSVSDLLVFFHFDGIKNSLGVTKAETMHNKILQPMAWNIPEVPTTQNTQGRAGIEVFHYSAVWVWPDTRRMKKSLSWQSSFGQEANEL